MNILARLSAYGIDPFTLTVGKGICRRFKLCLQGHKKIESAIQKLSGMGIMGNVLRLGFGVTPLPKQLITTEEGTLCLALCAALSEFYHEDLGAEILYELVRLNNIPDDFTPSISEWRSLLRAFQGIFSATEFPLIIEKIRLLAGETSPLVRECKNGANVFSLLRHVASAQSIAKALQNLSLVSSGSLLSIHLIGAVDAAWLAAFSIWILGLRTLITNPEGDTVYANCRRNEEQVHVTIQSTRSNETDQDLAQLTTFRLDTGYHLIQASGPRGSSPLMTSGRVDWDICLSSTFGATFKRLSGMINIVGTVIGSAACIFKAVNLGLIPGISSQSTYRCLVDSSHGKGFVQNVLRWFPELSKARETMDKAACASFLDAKCQFEAKMTMLETTCYCFKCVEGSEMDQSDLAHKEPIQFKEDYCLVVLLETIIVVAQSLSYMNVAEGLFPTRGGLEHSYLLQLDLRRGGRLSKNDGVGFTSLLA